MVNKTKNGEDLFLDHSDFPQIVAISSILAVFSIVGTTGNAFVLYVFSRKKDKNTSTVFIIALAATDFLTCLFIIPFTIVVEFMYKKVDNDFVCKIYQFLITSNVPFSAFIMVAIAFDRYFCICRPWLKVLDIKLAKRVIFSLLLFAITLGLITCLAYGVYHQKDKDVTEENTIESNCNISACTNQSVMLNSNSIKAMIAESRIGSSAINRTYVGEDWKNMSLGNNKDTPVVLFTGFCYPNELILGKEIRKIYQKFYASLFLIAFIIVLMLYALIYKSILTRRSKKLRTSMTHRHFNGRRSTLLTSLITRQSEVPNKTPMAVESLNNKRCDNKQNNNSESSAVNRPFRESRYLHKDTENNKKSNINDNANNANDETVSKEADSQKTNNCTPLNYIKPYTNKTYPRKSYGKSPKNNNQAINQEPVDHISPQRASIEVDTSVNHDEEEINQLTTITIYRQDTRKSVREKHMIANIKTAGILFIVTLVFILAFLPSWLMATQIIPANMVVFYMYFCYNVANPVIYAFCNHTFQKEVQYVLGCKSYWTS